MGLVEKAAELFRRVDQMMQPVPAPSVRGSERFPNTRDWQVLKWTGVVTLGIGVGIAGGVEVATVIMALEGKPVDFLLRSPIHMYDNYRTVLEVFMVGGLGIGLFGGIAAANRIIER